MTTKEVMDYLESKGTEQTRKTFLNHGAVEPFFGVKVGDMKPIEKKERNNHSLALELYATGNSDAQYLAGLIADPKQFTASDLKMWAEQAGWHMVSEYAVAWNLAEHPNCVEIACEWIDNPDPKIQAVAWAGLSAHVLTVFSDSMDLSVIKTLLARVEKEIHQAENRVRYCMNNFVIAAGGAFPEFTETCKEIGDKIGKVEVNVGNTACKVPSIRSYIEKMEEKGRIGKKKAKAKC